MGKHINGDGQHEGAEGKQIKTPQKDFDKLAYFAGMALRALLPPGRMPTDEEAQLVANASIRVALALMDAMALQRHKE